MKNATSSWESSARGGRPLGSGEIMKRKGQTTETGPVEKDEILPEYDFTDSRPNKYAARYVAAAPS